MIAPTALVLMSALTFAGFKGHEAHVAVQPAHRISGITAFHMPDLLARQMNRDEEGETDYRGVVCVGADGVPRSIKTIQRTGVRQADEKVEKTVRGWRYTPFMVRGRPTGFCTGFTYRFEIPHEGMVNPASAS
jgi:Gram-negative bacterial TonB protein C-terminal